MMNNHNCHDTQSVGIFGNERDSINKINFSKPVNKLVNNVAAAIGESVRRMQPRS